MVLPRALRAASFLMRLSGDGDPGRWAAFDRAAAPPAEVTLVARGRTLRARRFLPVGAPARATLLVVPGFHPQGVDDPRLAAFATAAAHAGFAVVAVDLPEMRAFQVTDAAVDAVAGSLEWILQQPGRGPRVGALGISYGAGPLFIAAAQPGLARRVDFVLAVGAYYDLADTLAFGLTGEFAEGEGGALTRLEPHPWARLIFARNFAAALVSPDDAPVLAQAVGLKLGLDDAGAEARAAALSADGAQVWARLNGPASPALAGLAERAGAPLRAACEAVSPRQALTRLQARVYLLHGAGDDVVPRSETARIARALRQAGRPPRASLVTAVFSHVTAQQTSLAERLALWRFAYAVVGEAG